MVGFAVAVNVVAVSTSAASLRGVNNSIDSVISRSDTGAPCVAGLFGVASAMKDNVAMLLFQVLPCLA